MCQARSPAVAPHLHPIPQFQFPRALRNVLPSVGEFGEVTGTCFLSHPSALREAREKLPSLGSQLLSNV